MTITTAGPATTRAPLPIGARQAYTLLAGTVLLAYAPSYISMIASILLGTTAQPPPSSWVLAAASWAKIGHMLALVIAAAMITTRMLDTTVRDGLGIAPRWARRSPDDGWWDHRHGFRAWWVWAAACAIFIGSGILVSAVSALTGADGSPMTAHLEDLDGVLWAVAVGTPAHIMTAGVEEIVMLGLVVLVLGAARRPVWEMCAVSAVTRVGMHAYYGWEALAMAPAAIALVWLYARTRRLTPIMIAHAYYNLMVSGLMIAAFAVQESVPA